MFTILERLVLVYCVRRGGVSLFAAAERHAAQGNVAVVEAGAQHAAFSTSNFGPAEMHLGC